MRGDGTSLWTILAAGAGVAILLEGVAYAVAPELMKRYAEWLRSAPVDALRQAGVAAAVLGLIVLYAAIRLG